MSARFTDVIDLVEETFPSPDAGADVDRVRAVAQQLTRLAPTPDAARALLADYLESAASGRIARGSSHWHPNGFDKLSLYRSARSDARIRLHVWWNGEDALESTIHDHRWHFASYIVAGRMIATNFREIDDGERALELEAVATSDILGDDHKRVERLGLRRLRATASYAVRAGDVHSLHAEVPHQVLSELDGLSATLVITAPPIRDTSITYRRRAPEDGTQHYPRFAQAEILERLSALLTTLQ